MSKLLTDQDRSRLAVVALRFGLPASVFQVADTGAAFANLKALEAVRKQALREGL